MNVERGHGGPGDEGLLPTDRAGPGPLGASLWPDRGTW